MRSVPGPSTFSSWPMRRKHHHNVYVIELDPAILNIARFRNANPDHDLLKPCVYVGMTGLTEMRHRRNSAISTCALQPLRGAASSARSPAILGGAFAGMVRASLQPVHLPAA